MIDRVAQDVQQRIEQLVQHFGVDQDVLADDDELRPVCWWRGRLAHVALQARHDGLDRRHARLRSQVRQFAHQALLLVQDAGEAGELVLEAQAEVARVGGFLDQRARDATALRCTGPFPASRSRCSAVPTACSLWRAATPRMSTEFSSSNRRFWMDAVLFDELARMAGGGFQFLFELADLDGELAHHAHQVVEQLRGHARHGARFGARRGHGAWPGRCCIRRRDAQAAGSAPSVGEIVVARRIEHLDDARARCRARVFAGHGGHHLLEAVGRGHERAARAAPEGGDRFGFADLEHVFEPMRELGDAADAQDIRRALERVRGAFGVAQQLGLRRVGDPALQ